MRAEAAQGAMSLQARIDQCTNPVTKSVLGIMAKKKTNLCVAADLTSAEELLELVDIVGPHICILKLHIDILIDYSPSFVVDLLAAKAKYEFLIFEDRKFADIGSTVANQYKNGIYRIAEWADLVTVHSVPGPGIISGLKSVAEKLPVDRAILLLAEMSSSENLCSAQYASATIEMAASQKDFVAGFISQSRPSSIDPTFLVLTPGVSLDASNDSLGQRYNTPESAVKRGSDVIIVGRAIYAAADMKAQTERYKEAGFSAFTKVHGNV